MKPDWPDAQFGPQKAPAWRGQGTELASLCRVCGRFIVGPPTQHFCAECADVNNFVNKVDKSPLHE
jgi:uncharacterized OB-fold protein